MIFRKFLSQRTVMPYSATPPKPAMTRSDRGSRISSMLLMARNGTRLPAASMPDRAAGSGSIFSPSIATTAWPWFIR